MAKNLSFTVGADVAPGSRAFQQLGRDVKREMKGVDDALDESKTNAQRISDAYVAAFEAIDAQMLETEAAADALAIALGPEIAGRIDTAAAVQEFQKLGLTLDEIKADADSLAVALKTADDISLRRGGSELEGLGDSARRAKGDMDGVRDSSDQTRSVMANLVGNATQDMGALGGVAGSAGVAIGQLGEYATDGTISVKGLTQLAGPMAALGLATLAVGEYMDGINAEKAFRKDLVEDFNEAIGESQTLAEELRDTLKETGDIQFSKAGGGMLGFGREMSSILPIIEDLGISWDQVIQDMSDPAAPARIREQLKQALLNGDDDWGSKAGAMKQYADAIDQYGDSWRDASDRQKAADEFATALDRTIQGQKASADELTGALEATEGATRAVSDTNEDAAVSAEELDRRSEGLARRQEEAAQRAEDLARKTEELRQEQMDAVGSTHDLERAVLDNKSAYAQLEEQMMRNGEVQNDAELSDREKEQSSRDLRGAELDLAGQVYDTADAFAEQAIKNGDARSKSDLMRDALIMQREEYPSLRGAIQAYIDKLDAIPRTVNTTVNLRQGSTVAAGPVARGIGIEAGGGTTYEPDGLLTLVGENGPELIRKGPGDHTYTNGESRQLAAAAPRGGDTFNIYGSSTQEVVAEIQAAQWRKSAVPVAGRRR